MNKITRRNVNTPNSSNSTSSSSPRLLHSRQYTPQLNNKNTFNNFGTLSKAMSRDTRKALATSKAQRVSEIAQKLSREQSKPSAGRRRGGFINVSGPARFFLFLGLGLGGALSCTAIYAGYRNAMGNPITRWVIAGRLVVWAQINCYGRLYCICYMPRSDVEWYDMRRDDMTSEEMIWHEIWREEKRWRAISH